MTLSDALGETAFRADLVASATRPPSSPQPGLVLSPSDSIDENGTVTVSGTIASAGGIHTNTVQIDWGDGSAPTTIVLPPGDPVLHAAHLSEQPARRHGRQLHHQRLR